MKAAASRLLALAACAAAGAVFAGAQAPPPPTPGGDPTAFHVVRSGDTLEALTQSYLGDASRWRENWALNPQVKDPHLLRPGQRIVILVGQRQHKAEIEGLSRRVESKPHPDPAWIPARVGEVLRERDGLRTYAKSSADLAFDDGSHLLVSEQSLVFLREVGTRLAGSVSRRSIEILDGQADVRAKTAPKLASGIEIVVGGARAQAQATAGHGMETRARTASGGAHVMVYEGTGSVAAGGREVLVPGGMGTAVPKGGPPAAPEALLPAPRVVVPAAGGAFDQANPRFAWRPVDGARSYTVEVCADAQCGQLVDRATGVTRTSWAPDGLPLGDLQFRVTAVAGSGLDGFPSPAVPFRIESLWRRPEPAAER